MIQMAILNLCRDSGCRKRAGCRTCIFSRGSRAVLTFTLAVVFLKVKFVVAVLQNTGTTAAETAEGGVAVSGYQIASTAFYGVAEALQENKGVLMLQVFFLGFKWQKHPLKGNEQSFMKLQSSRCREKLFKTQKNRPKRCFDNKLIV